MTKIGFMGLGAMGSRMAARLLEAGHAVTVYNRSAAAAEALVTLGAQRAGTPREAAQSNDFVFSMVTDDAAAKGVWLEGDHAAVHGLAEGALAVECSTVTPTWIAALAEGVRSRGATLVDAPLAGSRPQAEAGQLVFFVGCPRDTFERAQPILASMGGAIHHVGPAGNGALFKLSVNALFATQVELLGELLGMLKKAGIAPGAAMEVLGQLPVTSPAAKGVGGLIARDTYAPLFPVDLVAKDMRYAEATAKDLELTAPTITSVRETYEQASERGYGGLNIHGVAKLFLE